MSGLIERALDALFEYQLILDGCEADSQDATRSVYLKRYFIVTTLDPAKSAGQFHQPRFNLTRRRTTGGSVLLHKICRSDVDPEMHDHPWDFTSVILWRGYREETRRCDCGCTCAGCSRAVVARKWPGMILRRRAEHRHRVLIGDGPAWTLVFTSVKKRSWFFWRDATPIPWREFISRKCEPGETP